jgi:hypothetical protein
MKSDNLILAAALSLLAISFSTRANAQTYHYSWGGTRVVNQGQIGLSNPSGTYIGPGTMSKSAQGAVAPVTNPNLPNVNMGAHIGRPGDNQYGPNRMFSDQPWQPMQVQQGQPIYQRPASNGLPPGRMGAHIGLPGDDMRSDLHPYTPGQNMQPQVFQSSSSQPTVDYHSSNTPATYGDTSGSAMHY